MLKPLKILALPCDEGGCGMYRVRQPLAMLQEHTEHDTHVIDKDEDSMLEVATALSVADIIVCRPGVDIPLSKIQLSQTVEAYGKEIGQDLKLTAKWVMDIDDNVEEISPYSYHFSEYGTYEFYDKVNQRQLWKDGVAGFSLAKNKAKIRTLIDSLKAADLITVTTPQLATYAQSYNTRVYVVPNAINTREWWHIPPTTPFRLGWAGGISHYDDFHSVRKPLNNFLKKTDAEFHIIGNGFPGVIDHKLRKQVFEHPWVPFKGHSYHLAALQLSAALIPLQDLPFNHYKSCVKWYEMSALGIPSVVANVVPYNTEIEDGVTGLLYSSDAECLDKLRWVYTHPVEAAKIGQNARAWVEQHRDSKQVALDLVDAYRSIL